MANCVSVMIKMLPLFFSHHMGIPNAAPCDISGDCLDRCSSPEHFVSDSVIPDFARLIHLKILTPMVFILWRSALCNA